MNVIIIMACALVGTIALLFLAGAARWSFIYLIRHRFLKKEVQSNKFALSTQRDILAAVIAVITLIAVGFMLVYGVPFVAQHFSEMPLLPAA